MNRFVLLTNIPTPYRTPFFNTLAEELDRYAIELHVLYCAASEPNRHWELDLDAQRYPWRILSGLHATVGSAYMHFNPGIVTVIRKLSPRWLLIGGAWHLPTVWIASRRVFSSKAARILWTEGQADALLNRQGSIAALRRRAFGGYDAFAVPNTRSGEFARAEAGRPTPILPLPNTVDEEFYTVPEDLDRASLRARLGVAPGVRVIVSLSQLDERKGVSELARGYRAVPAEVQRNSMLVFLGDGDRRPDLEAIAGTVDPGEIRLLGNVSGEVVRSWLWAADIFSLTTRLDPNPLSPIEASFAQLPLLLSSKAGNVDELVQEGETGWRIESIEDTVIRDRLSLALATGETRLQEMGRAARDNANSSFRRTSVAQRFVTALLKAFPIQPEC